MPGQLFNLIPSFKDLVFYAFVCRWPSILLFTRADRRGKLHNMTAFSAACTAPGPATPPALRPSQQTRQTRRTHASTSTHAPGLFAPPQKVTAAPQRSTQRAARAAVPPPNPRPPAPPTPAIHATNSYTRAGSFSDTFCKPSRSHGAANMHPVQRQLRHAAASHVPGCICDSHWQ
jgi:hypothetical protein